MAKRPAFPWRVIFLCHSPHLTGAQRMLANFILRMDRSRIDPLVITRAPGPSITALEQAGIPCFEVPFQLALPLAQSARTAPDYLLRIDESAQLLARAIANLEADLVLVNTSVVVQGVLAARSAGLPCVVDLRGIMSAGLLPGLETRLLRTDEATLLGAADGIIAHSAWTRSFVVDTYGLPADAVRIIPNGIDLPQNATPVAPDLDGPRRFVSLCTLEPNKNVPLFLDAAERVLADGRFDRVEFHIYGHGDAAYRKQIEERLGQPALRGRCFLHGRTDDVDAVYESCFAAVVTSHIESFSNVCVEAMCHGRPVISTRCGGPEDILEDGVSGFLVDHSPDALASRMMELLADPARAQAMGQAAYVQARERYNLAKLAPQYEDALIDVCERYWSSMASVPAVGARLRGALIDLIAEYTAVTTQQATSPAPTTGKTAAAPAPTSPAEQPPPKPTRSRRTVVPTPAPDGYEIAATRPIVAPIRYRIVPTRDRWAGLRLCVGTHQRRNTCTLGVVICPLASPTFRLREAEVSCAELEDNEWCEVHFAPISESANAPFILSLIPIGAGTGNAVSVYEWQPPAVSNSLWARARRRLTARRTAQLYAELLHEG